MAKRFALWSVPQGTVETSPAVGASRARVNRPSNSHLHQMRQHLSSELAPTSHLAMMLHNPDCFFEKLWPELRNWLQRQTVAYRFESPLRLSQVFKYELILPNDSLGDEIYLFIGCLSDYLPVLEVRVNGYEEVVLRGGEASAVVRRRLENYADVKQDLASWPNLRTDAERREFLEQAIEETVRERVPMFIRLTKADVVGRTLILSLSCVGDPFTLRSEYASRKFKTKFLAHEQCLPIARDAAYEVRLRKYWRTFLDAIKVLTLPVPLEEPEIFAEIHSKNHTGSLWVYGFAPPGFNLGMDAATASSNEVVIRDVTKDDPESICLRVASLTDTSREWACRLVMKIRTPGTHRLWLMAMNGLYAVLILLWLLACGVHFRAFEHLPAFDEMGKSVLAVIGKVDLLATSVVFVSLSFVARSWLIYEETVFRLTSYKLAANVVILSLLAVVARLLIG